ncbi:MAG TPA: MFS transporter [Streptosporangiaceae bacterium]|nr:MFS transporter [Streptosporangiaceae bacterium]
MTSRVPELLRDRPFRRYWSAQTISMFGDQISAVAVPYTGILALHANASEMGCLTAAIWLPSLLFAVHAGAWADRRGRRRHLMIAADLGRAGLLATVPVCAALHVLTLGQLYAAAFSVGSLSVVFTVCDPAMFVALVPEHRYLRGQSLLYGSRAFSFMGGPSLGGILVQLLTAPFAVGADALSFLGSAYFLSRIRPAEPPPGPAGRGTLTAGARYIAHHGVVRASLITAAMINFFDFMFVALFALYATRSLHIRPGELGLVLGAGAVGSLLGSLAARRISEGVGVGWTYVIGAVLFPAPLLLVPLASGPHELVLGALFASEFLSGVGVMVLDISIGSIFAAVIPDQLRSRVTGAFQAVNYGTRPVGALVAGALGTTIGVRPTLWLAAIGGTTAFLWLLPSPVPRFRLPDIESRPNVTVRTGTSASDE